MKCEVRGVKAVRDDSEGTKMPRLGSGDYTVLLPSVFGIAMGASVVSLAVQQAHATTGVSTFGGWSMVAACAVLIGLFLLTFAVKRFSKRSISLSVFFSIHIAGFASLALAISDLANLVYPPVAVLLLQAAATLGATLLEFYWMRKLRGTSAQAVVFVVFSALALSEALVFVVSFFGSAVWHVACVALMFMQFSTVRLSRSLGVPSDTFPAVSESYFGTDENHFSNRSFLVVAAMGVWFISIPIGMGRGFSAGLAIHLDVVPRAVLLAIVLIVSALWVRFALASRMRALTTSIWVVIELLMGISAILFAVWPMNAGMGGAFVMASALMLQAFVWYMTIAFISFGWRDPYYYTCAAWIAMNLLTVAGMRVDALMTDLIPQSSSVVIAVMSFFVLIGAQVVFTRLLASPSEQSEAAGRAVQAHADVLKTDERRVVTEADVRRIPLMGVMAISPQSEVPMASKTPDVHIATSVMEMGQRFGLTGREIEVLTLYALGHTQARVSEELQLSTNTVHTHIKRIYEKTDLHSRQEILDYISAYGK